MGKELYFIQIRMPSVYAAMDKDTRRRISAIRQSVNMMKKRLCIQVEGIHITNETGLYNLIAICMKSAYDMRGIDPSIIKFEIIAKQYT